MKKIRIGIGLKAIGEIFGRGFQGHGLEKSLGNQALVRGLPGFRVDPSDSWDVGYRSRTDDQKQVLSGLFKVAVPNFKF
jgi:hypothetical protein